MIQLYGKQLDRGGDETLATQLYEVLRHEILRGRWDVGERMPSYKDIAEQTGLHQWHIQGAFARLDENGYVERIRQKGIFVKTTTSPSNETLGKLLLIAAEEDIVAERHWNRRSAIETQGFGLVDTRHLIKAAEQLGLRMTFCPVVTTAPATEAPPLAFEPNEPDLFGAISLLPAGLLQKLRGPGCRVPTVYLGGDDPFSTPCITGNPSMAAYRVAEALLELGHQHIAVMSDPRLHGGIENGVFAGIVQAMRDAGLDARPDALPIMRHPEAPVPAGCTAVFSFSIELAQACFKAQLAKGLNVPGDLSIACLQAGRTQHPDAHGKGGSQILGARYAWEAIISTCFEMLLAQNQHPEQSPQQLIFNPGLLGDHTVGPPNKTPSQAQTHLSPSFIRP